MAYSKDLETSDSVILHEGGVDLSVKKRRSRYHIIWLQTYIFVYLQDLVAYDMYLYVYAEGNQSPGIKLLLMMCFLRKQEKSLLV